MFKVSSYNCGGLPVNSMRTLNGGWSYSWQGEKTERYTEKFNTILEAVQNEIGANNVKYIPGASCYKYQRLS